MGSNVSRVQIMVVAALATGVVLLALVGAAWACFITGNPNTNPAATANAVSTNVQETLIAMGTLPPPATTVIEATQPPIIAPTATAPPNTPFQPPTPTNIPPSPTPLARGNGTLFTAARRTGPVTLNGALDEWPNPLPGVVEQATFRSENWTGVSDLSARYAVNWDDNFLYLAVQVTDDAHVQTQRGETLFRGDSVEILLDTDLAGDFASAELSTDDFQIGFSPGALNGDLPEAWLWFPTSREGAPTSVSVAAQSTTLGYNLEAAIPWSVFGIRPNINARFGFTLSISDNDSTGAAEQQTMVSSVATRRLTDPTSWGTLELGP